MQHIITDEEVSNAIELWFRDKDSFEERMRATLTDFLNNRPESTLGKLRPIAEMSDNLATGATRMYGFLEDGPNAALKLGDIYVKETDSVFVDLVFPTPDHEAEERQRFEEAMKGRMWMPADFEFKNGEYATPSLAAHYDTWKLAKSK